MTVKELKSFVSYGTKIALKDTYNGRVYTNIDKYLDKEVQSVYPRIIADKRGDYATVTLVAWIPHDFEEREAAL
jgi:hypothetical protein